MIQNLDSHTLVLTANSRLSTYLKKKYDMVQSHTGKKTWQTLNCLPFDQWIYKVVENATTTHTILNDAQELALWENIISQANCHNAIYHPFKIAEIAQQAWHLIKQWRVSLDEISTSFSSDDARLFHQWATTFATICKKQRWLIQDDCTDLLIQALQTSTMDLPKNIVIAGFDEFTSQKKYLISLLEKYTHVNFYKTQKKTNTIPSRIKATDENQEILYMARWAKKTLFQYPNASIACVAPHLNQIHGKIISVFTEVFSDNPTDILNERTLPFNISSSHTFYENPLVYTAFQILSLNTKEIELTKISALLRSPFIRGSQTEIVSRAKLNELLHQTEERIITLPILIRIAEKNSLCPQFITSLKNLADQQSLFHEKKQINLWKDKIILLLDSIGWPGERVLNSNEYQQFQRWQKLLEEFTQIDVIHAKFINFFQAITQLKILSQKTQFQSETSDTPIQILGILEASGMTFDHLWIMGMNDDKWPQPPSPHSFIPITLQRKYNMPHASHEKEFLFSQAVTHRLQQSAENIVFSYSQQKEDIILRASKLIQEIPEKSIMDVVGLPKDTAAFITLEALVDNLAPPITAHEKIWGGASTLKDQSACPFRAFAKHRLGAKTLSIPKSGLSPQERGNLVHDTLENIWHVLQNHETLHAYQENDLNRLIEDNIYAALIKKSEHLPFTLKKQFIQIEHQRLFKLIKQWLAIEKQRPSFSVIAHETTQKINFEGLTLNLRIDREDQLENNERIIIDYKTGVADIKSWFGERPDDPQLPLYCLTTDHTIKGLLFAQIRPQASQFKGITDGDYNISGVKTIETQKADTNINNWSAFKEIQHQTLSNLSKDFQSGIANVDPKNSDDTCQYCDLKALCRLHTH